MRYCEHIFSSLVPLHSFHFTSSVTAALVFRCSVSCRMRERVASAPGRSRLYTPSVTAGRPREGDRAAGR